MKAQLLCLFLLLILFSCKEKEVEPALNEDTARREIIGKWKTKSIKHIVYEGDKIIDDSERPFPVEYYTFGENTFDYEEIDLLGHEIKINSIPYNISTVDGKVMFSFSLPPVPVYYLPDPILSGDSFLYEIETMNSNKMQWKNEVVYKHNYPPDRRAVITVNFIR